MAGIRVRFVMKDIRHKLLGYDVVLDHMERNPGTATDHASFDPTLGGQHLHTHEPMGLAPRGDHRISEQRILHSEVLHS